MKARYLPLAAMLFSGMAVAADVSSIVQGLDAGADVQRQGAEVTIVTTAQRVTPHDAPFTDLIPALCDSPEALAGLEKVIVLNQHAFQGVEFWTYDETPDLRGTCEKIAGGTALQGYAVMH